MQQQAEYTQTPFFINQHSNLQCQVQNQVNLLQFILLQYSELTQKVNFIKQQVIDLQKKHEELDKRNIDIINAKQPFVKVKKLKQKKIFKKDKLCEFQGCDHKYSSAVALNAHIKREHQEPNNDSQEYAP